MTKKYPRECKVYAPVNCTGNIANSTRISPNSSNSHQLRMASEDIIKNISRETSNALKEMAVREPAEIPAHLRGKLSKVLSSVANEESEVPVFVPGNVVFRGSDPL